MRRHKRLTLILLLATTAFCPIGVATAQRRGEAIEGLLKGFLESQLERERRRTVEQQRLMDRQRHQPDEPAQREAANRAAVNKYRARLRLFAEESAALTGELQRSAGRNRAVRPLLSEAITLKARSQLMYDRSRSISNLSLVREEYRALDSLWRELSFKLQQIPNLDATTTRRMRLLSAYCAEFCDQLELKPQFDRAAVQVLTIEAKTHLATLMEDIQIELYQMSGAAELERQCHTLMEQCRRLARLAGNAENDELVRRYSTFVKEWRAFAVKLYPINNAHCQRSVRRVHACTHQLFQQLRAPLELDRAYLNYISHAFSEEVNSLFENMTVKTLVTLSPAEQKTLLGLARDLYGHCKDYCQHVDSGLSVDRLVKDYAHIESQWPSLDRQLRSLDSPAVERRRRLISAYEVELRGLLKVPTRLDQRHAVDLAASLEEMAEHLRYDVRAAGRYFRTSSFRNLANQRCETFHVTAKSLHARLQRGATLSEVQSSFSDTLKAWNGLATSIQGMTKNGLSVSRYRHIEKSQQELLPVLAELATMLGG